MQELEITGSRIASVWWLLMWRGWLGGLVIGCSVAYPVGYGLRYFLPDSLFNPIYGIVGVAIPAAIFFVWWPIVVRMALQKRYGDFRIILVPTETIAALTEGVLAA